MDDLQVKYFGNDIIPELDKKIEKFFKSLGYEWVGSGFCFVKPTYREISFEVKKLTKHDKDVIKVCGELLKKSPKGTKIVMCLSIGTFKMNK